jgi:hypothetical protein
MIGNLLNKQLNKRFLYKKNNDHESNGNTNNFTPYIGNNGNWWIGDTDTNVKAAGQDGRDGQDFNPAVVLNDSDANVILHPQPGTYYVFENTLISLTIDLVPQSYHPIIIWFYSGEIPTTLNIPSVNVLFPISGIQIEPNRDYEISIINKRMTIASFQRIRS